MTLSKVYSEVKERQFKVDLAFAGETPPTVRRGQTLQLRLEIGASSEGGLVVANGPFYEDTGGQWAFVVSTTGSGAERRAIKLGRRNPGERRSARRFAEGRSRHHIELRIAEAIRSDRAAR